jgi:RNA polymerase sigma factor (sigma-70 family)
MSSLVSTQTRESTTALLQAAGDSHPLAWEELVRRYNRLVRSTVASFRLQPADAEDAVQNTWLRVMERMDTIRDPQRLGGWLTTTASRECLALIRRRQREVPDDVAGTQLPATEDGPDVVVIASESQRAVTTAVEELPQRRQELIRLLFYQLDCSYVEVSRATGMPSGSIGPTRSRVLRELRSTLEQRGFGPAIKPSGPHPGRGSAGSGS